VEGDLLMAEKAHILKLQSLVDELMKTTPDEAKIKILMKSLNIKYESDPIQRITYVMDSMNRLVKNKQEKKVEYDL
jgi:hypothetical protein